MWTTDVPGQCNAHLYIGDDFGDNSATIRCQLPFGHEGAHIEKFSRGEGAAVTVTWDKDERCWTYTELPADYFDGTESQEYRQWVLESHKDSCHRCYKTREEHKRI